MIHYSHGRTEEARQAYERALQLGPNVTIILNGFAHYLSFLGEDHEAIRLAKRAQALTPNDASWHARLGVPLMFGDSRLRPRITFVRASNTMSSPGCIGCSGLQSIFLVEG